MMKFLKNKGLEMNYVWGAYDLLALRPVLKIGKQMHKKRGSRSPKSEGGSVKLLLNSRLLSFLYRHFTLLEYRFEIFFKIYVPLKLGKSVLSDRYVYDTIINLSVNLNDSVEDFKANLFKFSASCPKPDLVVYVDVPEEVAFQRKDDIPSINYLKKRRKLYLTILKDYNFVALDGFNPPECVEQQMKAVLEAFIATFGAQKLSPCGIAGEA
jgi:dTMP kinase